MRGAIEKGNRVYLREPRESDRDEFVRLARASRKLHRPWVYAPETGRQFDGYLIRARAASERCFLVVARADESLVGVYNLSQIARGFFQSAYLGYYAGRPYAGHGYMGEGMDLVLRHAFTRMRLHRVEANVQPENVASLALVKRSGFRLEGFSPRYLKVAGRWRDHQRWAILNDDWRRLRRRPRGPSRCRARL